MSDVTIIPGCKPMSHTGTRGAGVLVLPVLIYTSHNDHVVPPENSEHIANTVGGAVEHVWLDRSFHVATQDFDRDDITAGAAAFVARVTGA